MSDGSRLFGFDGSFLRKLEQVALVSRRPMVGTESGSRRSPRHGSSAEFADFREYSPGDDLRRVDWNAYARLDRLFLRLYTAEEVATLTLYLDCSRSMGAGETSKARAAARLAAVLAYVGLAGHDHVAVTTWSDSLDRYLAPQVGLRAVPYVWRFIDAAMAKPTGSTDFAALSRHGPFRRRTGISIVISDFLSESDWRGGLLSLQSTGQEVTVVQVLAREEIDPWFRGDWQLRDVEDDTPVEVTISPRSLRQYHQNLDAHLADIREFCRRRGMRYLLMPSDEPIEDTLLARLQAVGVVA